MSTDTFDGTNTDWSPTRISTALTLGGAVVLVGLLLWQIDDILIPIAAGSLGALSFAGSLWLLDFDGQEAVTAVVVSLLALPVGAGILLAGVATALVLTSSVFPVGDTALLSVGALVIVGHVGIVWGIVFAILGVTLGVRNAGEPASFIRYWRLALLTGIVPAAVGIAFVTSAVVFADGDPAGFASGAVGEVVSMALSPDPATVQFAQFCLLLALAAWTFHMAIQALPVAEILADRGAGETHEQRLERFLGGLSTVTMAATVALLVVGVLQLGQSTAEIESLLGPDVYDILQSVATASVLRVLFVGLTLVSVVALCLGWSVRWVARSTSDGIARRWGPIAAGGVITVGSLSLADPVYTELVEQSASRMPEPIAGQFREFAFELAGAFGVGTLVVSLATLLIATTVILVLGFRIALFFGYLSTETAGYSLASGGLFVATVFAGTVGAPAWLVFGGVVVSLFVWDVGQFGTTLGTEVGRQTATRGTEFVHAGGTLLVGAVGAGGAFVVASRMDGVTVVDSTLTVVALLSVVAGILLLVAALR